jgi:hypothetical protein
MLPVAKQAQALVDAAGGIFRDTLAAIVARPAKFRVGARHRASSARVQDRHHALDRSHDHPLLDTFRNSSVSSASS